MIATARVAAFDALREIEAKHLDLGEAVARVRKPLADERDRALLLELVSGTLRMQAAIDFQLASRVSRSLSKLDEAVRIVLRMSGFQLLYLSRIPASAVINDAVELTRRAGKSSAAGLVNAVLRALARDREQLTWPAVPPPGAAVEAVAEYLAVVQSHPAWLVSRWLERHGRDATERWLEFNNHAAALCLVPNRTLVSRDALAEELRADGVETEPTVTRATRPARRQRPAPGDARLSRRPVPGAGRGVAIDCRARRSAAGVSRAGPVRLAGRQDGVAGGRCGRAGPGRRLRRASASPACAREHAGPLPCVARARRPGARRGAVAAAVTKASTPC